MTQYTIAHNRLVQLEREYRSIEEEARTYEGKRLKAMMAMEPDPAPPDTQKLRVLDRAIIEQRTKVEEARLEDARAISRSLKPEQDALHKKIKKTLTDLQGLIEEENNLYHKCRMLTKTTASLERECRNWINRQAN